MRFRRWARHSAQELAEFLSGFRAADAKSEARLRRSKREICRREIKAALADGDTAAARELQALADAIGPVNIRAYRKFRT